jgi:hypothetical protein
MDQGESAYCADMRKADASIGYWTFLQMQGFKLPLK